VIRNELAFALRDTTPTSDLHTLVLPFRHAPTYFDLSPDELVAVNHLLWRLRDQILAADPSVAGFNNGANIGVVSGQTIFHCHIHLIPRRAGDVDNPLAECGELSRLARVIKIRARGSSS
jgi:ATP adenylyltransferase